MNEKEHYIKRTVFAVHFSNESNEGLLTDCDPFEDMNGQVPSKFKIPSYTQKTAWDPETKKGMKFRDYLEFRSYVRINPLAVGYVEDLGVMSIKADTIPMRKHRVFHVRLKDETILYADRDPLRSLTAPDEMFLNVEGDRMFFTRGGILDIGPREILEVKDMGYMEVEE